MDDALAAPKPTATHVEAAYAPTPRGPNSMPLGMMGMQDPEPHSDHDHENTNGIDEFLISQRRSCATTQDGGACEQMAASPPDVSSQQAQDASDIAEGRVTANHDATLAVGSGGETMHGTTHAGAQGVPAPASHGQLGLPPFKDQNDGALAVEAQANVWSTEVRATVSDSAVHSRTAVMTEHVEHGQLGHPKAAPEASGHASGYSTTAELHLRATAPNSLETDLSAPSTTVAKCADELGNSGVVNDNSPYCSMPF